MLTITLFVILSEESHVFVNFSPDV